MRTQLVQTGRTTVTWDILAVIGILSLIHIFIKGARIAKLLLHRVNAVLENANESVQKMWNTLELLTRMLICVWEVN